jgi:hypothetical protein
MDLPYPVAISLTRTLYGAYRGRGRWYRNVFETVHTPSR